MSYNCPTYMEQGGAVLRHESSGGGYTKESVITTTAAGTLYNCGVSVLAATANATYTMAAPVAGVQKEIVAYTTFTHTVRASSDLSVVIGKSDGKRYSLSIAPTTKDARGGETAILRGLSTTQWAIVGHSTVSAVTLTTACT